MEKDYQYKYKKEIDSITNEMLDFPDKRSEKLIKIKDRNYYFSILFKISNKIKKIKFDKKLFENTLWRSYGRTEKLVDKDTLMNRLDKGRDILLDVRKKTASSNK